MNTEFGPHYEFAVPHKLILMPLSMLTEPEVSKEELDKINDFAIKMVDNELDDYMDVIRDLGDIMGQPKNNR